MQRPITGYHLDEESDWVAELDCGHQQHVRHKPPFFNRPWTQTETGRTERIGTPLECPLCDRLEMPDGLSPIQRTPVFENESIPNALLSEHSTKAGIWAQIVVLKGSIRYVVQPPVSQTFILDETHPGTVAPQILHHIEPVGDVQFYVQLYKKSL